MDHGTALLARDLTVEQLTAASMLVSADSLPSASTDTTTPSTRKRVCAWRCTYPNTATTAASCAARTSARALGSATAARIDTLFGAENVSS